MALRLQDLRHVDIAQAEVLDLARALQFGEGAQAVLERRAGIVAVQQQQGQALDAERRQAASDHAPQMLRARIRHPATLGPRHAGLGHDAHFPARPVPAVHRGARQALAIVQVAVVQRVGIGGVEHPDAGVEGRVDHADRIRLRRPALGGQSQQAERERDAEGAEDAEVGHGGVLDRARKAWESLGQLEPGYRFRKKLKIMSATRIAQMLSTTARVVARPTPSAPPVTEKPVATPISTIRQPNTRLLISPWLISHGSSTIRHW